MRAFVIAGIFVVVLGSLVLMAQAPRGGAAAGAPVIPITIVKITPKP